MGIEAGQRRRKPVQWRDIHAANMDQAKATDQVHNPFNFHCRFEMFRCRERKGVRDASCLCINERQRRWAQ